MRYERVIEILNNLPHIFRGSIKEYRIPWISGIICLAAYKFLQLDFYHFYIYFFIASYITIYLQWIGWGELQGDGLIIRYGAFNFRKLLIKWNEIECVKTVYKTDNYIPLGGFGAMYDPKGTKIRYIGFEYKSMVPQAITSLVKKDQIKMLLGQTIDLLDSNILILKDEPSCGIDVFYKLLSEFVNVENIYKNGDNPIDDKRWWSFSYFDLFIILMPVIIICMGN